MDVNKEILKLDWEREPKGLYAPIAYTLAAGGKRVRPQLAMIGSQLFGGKDEEVLPAALALEVFHNFTLLHDDVMDKAEVRRGRPTVHIQWNENTAILSGDQMLIEAYTLLSQVPERALARVLQLFNKMATEICEGQQYDGDFEQKSNVTIEEYLMMIRLKTSVLLATSLRLGAYLAGASEEDQENLYAYGEKMGLAFQLQDDLLDVYADESLFGKKIGGDICCNKKTFLLITAMNLASPVQLAEMKEWMAKSEFDAEKKVACFTRIYDELGVRDICEKRIQALFDECDQYMANLSVAPEKKKFLKEFADSLLNRNI